MVVGVSGAVYKKYRNHEEALAAWQEASDAGLVEVV
jgi:hypothetical protein